MKRMVCEICGSHSIKKENDFFVCEECGTKYSLESARQLLQEVDENTTNIVKKTEKEEPKNNKNQLISILKSWLEYIDAFTGYESWFLCDTNLDDPAEHKINSNEFWNMNGDFIKNQKLHLAENLEFSDLEVVAINRRKRFFFDMKPYDFYDNLFSFHNSEYQKLEKLFDEAANKEFEERHLGGEKKYVLTSNDNKYTKDLGESLYGGASACKDFVKNFHGTQVNIIVMKTRTYEVEVGGFFTKHIEKRTENSTLPISKQVSDVVQSAINKRTQFINLHSERYQYIKEHFDEMINAYANLIDKKVYFEKMFYVPIKYRNVEILSAIVELLESGRADSWKEAVNIFEEENYRAKVLYNLNKTNIQLGRISSTLYEGFSVLSLQLKQINSSVSELSNNVSQLVSISQENNFALKNIMFDTRFSLIKSLIG